MKILKTFIYGLLAIVLITSCIKDEGNYDYVDVPLIDLSKVNAELNVFIGETINYTPDITTTVAESDLNYYWYIIHYDFAKFVLDTISTEKTLNTFVNFL